MELKLLISFTKISNNCLLFLIFIPIILSQSLVRNRVRNIIIRLINVDSLIDQ